MRESRDRSVKERALAAEMRGDVFESVFKSLGTAQTLAEAAPGILRSLGRAYQWDMGALWEVSPSPPLLRCVKVWRKHSAIGATFEDATLDSTFASGIGLPGRVWATGAAVWVADVTSDENFPRRPAAKVDGLRCALAFPVRSATAVYGVVEFFARRAPSRQDGVLDVATGLGEQIGQFVERRAAERQLRLILEQSLDASIVMSADGVVLQWNASAERIFGWHKSEAVGHTVSELIVPEILRGAHHRGLKHFLATGEGPLLGSLVETSALRRGGAEFPVELTLTPLRIDGVWSFHAFMRDITGRKALERKRQRGATA